MSDISPVEALAVRLFMSDPEQGYGHGAWDKAGESAEPIKNRYREFAFNLLQPCEQCPPSPLRAFHEVADMLEVSLPEPDTSDPRHIDFAAEIVNGAALPVGVQYSSYFGVVNDLRLLRDHLVGEQVKDAKRSELVEDARTVVTATLWGRSNDAAANSEAVVEALLGRFNITPKTA
jgi:hypothetical protein